MGDGTGSARWLPSHGYSHEVRSQSQHRSKQGQGRKPQGQVLMTTAEPLHPATSEDMALDISVKSMHIWLWLFEGVFYSLQLTQSWLMYLSLTRDYGKVCVENFVRSMDPSVMRKLEGF